MMIDAASMVRPADYPALSRLIWNGEPDRAIPAQEAFSIYERNWRHLDQSQLSRREADLIAALTDVFGQGILLPS
ncbi:hypothetical protein M2360_002690 [Rhizobium sp. SG_E_25_P2]|uniref:hypothetical protein n=1 Tax=Rhizobium sp. SG_E_25_P2 TaxID=2879942 RepID=UPI002474E517|nr:hypothetical protein [Rhizobium sp. SG_E_25_P2]MDH6267293.1 hypothetical protein [Rhizobium sp. SG_E_25_P2]